MEPVFNIQTQVTKELPKALKGTEAQTGRSVVSRLNAKEIGVIGTPDEEDAEDED